MAWLVSLVLGVFPQGGLFGGLVERRIGRVRLFVNAENLANVRQTDWDSIIRPVRAVDGRWTVDAWPHSTAA